jgi:hypothetical protein
MTTSFKSILRDSNVSLKLVEKSSIHDIKVFEITIPNPKKLCFYQVWNERTPISNALPFKTFVLNPSLFVAALDTFTAANPDVFYYPTIVMEIREKLYYVQAINFSINPNSDFVIQVTQDGFVTQRYQGLLENMNNVEIVMNISKIPCTVLFNVLKEQNFVDWLDCTYDKMGPLNTICKSSCSKNGENEFNSNYQGNVTIKPFKNNMSILSLEDPGQIMVYSIWDEEVIQDKTPHGNILFPISIADLYEIQKAYNQKVKSRHLSMEEYAFRPSVVITLKDNSGKSTDYLAVLEDITTNFESNLKNTDSQFSFIMSTQKFQGYPNLAMPRLPTGNFKMNMNIDALSSDQKLTFKITGTTPSNPSGDYLQAIQAGAMTNYGFNDYRLDVFNGSDTTPIFSLHSLNNYLNVNKYKNLAGGPSNAFDAPARIGSLKDYNNSGEGTGPSSFIGVTGDDNTIGATFSWLALINIFPEQFSFSANWLRNNTLNMAWAIYPLYNYLVNTKNYPQSSVIGSDDVPTEVPLQPGDGPVS